MQRRFLRLAAEAEGDVDVVGEARNGKEAVALVDRLRPAVVLMDLDLPPDWIAGVHACACNPMQLPHYPEDW